PAAPAGVAGDDGVDGVLGSGRRAPVEVAAEHAGDELGEGDAERLDGEAARVLVGLQLEQGEGQVGLGFAPAGRVAGEAAYEPGGANAGEAVAFLPLAVRL